MFIVKRSADNPLLAPITERAWEARGSFNGCPIKRGNVTHVLYRALGRPDALMSPGGLSTIGVATTLDGKNFQNRRQLIAPKELWERFGCEDPRVTYFEGQYVIFYTALGGMPFGAENIKVAVALSHDLSTIEERHLVTPFNAKAMALFPERIDGKITAILTVHTDRPPARVAIVQCDRIEELWDPLFWESWYQHLDEHTVDPCRFDTDHVEVGAPPVKTKEGWLLIYSHIQHYFGGGERVFGVEALLLDKNNPLSIIGATRGPMFVPEELYERYGLVPDIVFPSGALLEKGRLDIYYGAADTVTARVSIALCDLLEAMVPSKRMHFAKRAKSNPIIAPNPEHGWESRATFNTGAIDLRGTTYLFYRAMGEDNTSVIGLAKSRDGVRIDERLPEPIYVPRAEFEMKRGNAQGNSGCEDPRITKFGNRLYIAYTAFNGRDPWRGTLSSISIADFLARRFERWCPAYLVTPEGVNDKDVCLFPEKINGKYLLIHRVDAGGQICADEVETLDFKTHKLNRCIEIFGPRKGSWDSEKVGVASTPIKTKRGWLFLIEAVRRRPISLRAREIASLIGMFVLVTLMAIAFKNDVARKWDVIRGHVRELTAQSP